MHQAHGFVEFRQLGEWYGVVDVGALLVPNRLLSVRLMECAEGLGQTTLPRDLSINSESRIGAVQEHLNGVAVFTYPQLCALRRDAQVKQADSLLFEESLFSLLLTLCDSLASQFGQDDVRLVVYFD